MRLPQLSAGSVGITLFSTDDKLLATFLYATLKTWSYTSTKLRFELSSKAAAKLKAGLHQPLCDQYCDQYPLVSAVLRCAVRAGEPHLYVLETASGEAEDICELLTKNSEALNEERLKKKEEDKRQKPSGLWECVGASTVRATFERTSARVGRCPVGLAVEVADAQKNHDSQWRFRIGRAWVDKNLLQPFDRFVDDEGTVTTLADLRSKCHGWTSVATPDRSPLFRKISDSVPKSAADESELMKMDPANDAEGDENDSRAIPKAVLQEAGMQHGVLYDFSSVKGEKKKKVKKGVHMQLQLGGMGIQVLHDSMVVETYLYQTLDTYSAGKSKGGGEETLDNGYFQLAVKGSKNPLRFVTSRTLAKGINAAVAEKVGSLNSEAADSDPSTPRTKIEPTLEATDTTDETDEDAASSSDSERGDDEGLAVAEAIAEGVPPVSKPGGEGSGSSDTLGASIPADEASDAEEAEEEEAEAEAEAAAAAAA